jgi:uncharacterized protein YfaS (alpha-2-macroglobulin family)
MKRQPLYAFLSLLVVASTLFAACLGPRKATPTPTPAVPLTLPTSTPTPTPGPTPTPLPPDKAVPEGVVSPVVVQHSPLPGEELPLDGAVELVFDRAMDKTSVQEALAVSPAVDGKFEWPDDRTVRFVPANLKRGTDYHVYLAQDASDTEGAILSGSYRFRFNTVGFLEVAQVIPAPDSVDVEADSVVTLMFNRPVVPLTTLEQQADLPDPLTFDPPVAGSGEWLNTSVYVYTPEEPLAGGTRYAGRIAAGLEDTLGGLLENDYLWTFSTKPPKVVWTTPQTDGDRAVRPDTDIRIVFDQPVDPDSAISAFHLTRDQLVGGGEVDGTFEVLTETLIFVPEEMLGFDRRYTVRVEAGVQSTGGGDGMREAYEWQFVTAPLPRIVGTDPVDGERDAPPYTGFEILFNTVIDPETVMPNLEWTPPLSPTQVYTYFNEWKYSFGVYFGAEPSSEYTVRIGPDIADPYGNTTGQRMTVRFRTAPVDPMARLHVPGNVSTLNANDPARVFVQYINTDRLDLDLYRLNQDEFFDMQDEWYDYRPGERLRNWRERVDAPLNEYQYVRVDLVEGGGRLEPGFYLLDLTSPDVKERQWRERHLLLVSTVNLTVKSSPDEMLVWATDLDTGQPKPGIALQAYDWREGTPVGGEQRTDADGLARFQKPVDQYYNVVLIGFSPFVVGSDHWSQGISPWEFGFTGGESYQPYRVHVYTDRPIYRAGQTVYFRGLVRAEEDVAYSMPDQSLVQVTIRDTSGETILDERVSLDAFGAFHGQVDLADGAPLGPYYIGVQVGRYNYGQSFQVAAYRPPEFEVTVEADQPEVKLGQSNRAAVAVRYFFGGPVVDAPVQWNVIGETYEFSPPQFSRYSFSDTDDPWICRYCWWRPSPPPEVLLSGSGRTDADGNLTIELPGEWADSAGQPITHSLKLVVEATVSGADGQVISGRGEVIAHRSEMYVGLAAQQYVGQAQKEMSVDLVTVNWDAERLPYRELLLSVYRREWENVFVENEVGGGYWEWTTKDVKVTEERVTTGVNGEAVFTFVPPEGGSYHVIAEFVGVEPAARSSIFVWVSGRDYVSWRRSNEDRIDLIADKGAYVPGETAEILIPSPFEGQHYAWITVERGGILSQEVIRLESNSTVYRLPIEDRHVPNIYVSAVIVKGKDANNQVANHKLGYTALIVEPEPQELLIELTPNVEQAGPGDTVTFDVRATDHTGEPVSAAFSLDLVDKAVLSLLPRQPNAIVNAFYGRRALGVNTSSGLSISLNRLLIEQEELYAQATDAWEEKEALGGEGAMVQATAPPAPMAAEVARDDGARAKGGGAAAPHPGVELREEFADTAYWQAEFATDQTGRGQVEITVPDNLTTWVLRGVAATVDTRVGEATVELLVTKPLLVRPVTPRFFVVEDEAYLSALVSNNTDGDLDVEVALSSSGLVVHDPAAQTVRVPARGEAKVTWRVTVEDVPQVEVIFSAVSGELSDAARPRLTTGPDGTLLVYRYTAPEVVGTGGQLVTSGARTEVVALPPRYDDRRGELLIQLDPSLAAGMRDGLDYLEHFPYECTEQTVSRFLPNVLTYRAITQLGISNPELEKELPGLVEEGLDKLYLQQRGDGGWGWWYESRESNPYITAYVVFAMAKAREAGFAVKADVVQRGLDYLNGQLVHSRQFKSYRQANLQAFILYAMAEAGDVVRASEYTGDLWDNREKLSHYGRALLALTLDMIEPGDAKVQTLLSDLNNAAILSATGAHWEEQNYDWWAMNTDTRSTGIILDALARLDPENELIPNVVRWLMVARKDGIWETTQETAWALIAFTDWMVVTGELQGNYEYALALNGEELAAGTVNVENVDESVKLRVAVADLLADQGNYLNVGRGAGDGRLYYTAHLRVYLPVEEIDPANRGIIVYRQYADAACVPTKDEPCPELQEVKVGDTVRVKLTIIAPTDLYYVVVEDPLPAGGEAIDTGLATTSLLEQNPRLRRQAEDPIWYDFYWWWWHWYSRSELRDEKVVLFADYLPKGTYEYTYTFRATLPGEYRVIPTVASEMYFPEVFGRSDGRLLTIARGGE